MMEFVLASNNKKKIKELNEILSKKLPDIKILSLDDIGYKDEIIENGKTFAENAKIKASVPAGLGYIGIADDSGLCVDHLNGEPGIYSARYSGAGDRGNIEKLLENLKGVPSEERTAHFTCSICCVFPDGKRIDCEENSDGRVIEAEGRAEGIILEEERGDGGFGYDPLFYFPALSKTFSELTAEEKNKISHRANALKEFAEKIGELC